MNRTRWQFVAFACLTFTASTGQAQLIADSVTGFSSIQGQNGWSYGYYDKTGDGGATAVYAVTDFQLMTQFQGNTWWVNNVDSTTNGYFTRLFASGGHGNGLDNYFGRLRATREHFAVRRYTSSTFSPVRLDISISKIDTSGGNGTSFLVYLNGTPIFAPSGAPFTSATPSSFVVNTTLSPGDKLDLFLDPWAAQDANDNSNLTMKITAVPEPASIAAVGLGIVALGRRRRATS